MANEFDIGSLYAKAFGYQPPDNFTINKDKLDVQQISFDMQSAGERRLTSNKGQLFYAEDAVGREFFLPVWIDGYMIPFAVIGITCKKTVVSTPMPERGGSVSELISIDDYIINIKGMCVSENDEYPDGDIDSLFKLFEKNKTLKIRSVLTDIFLAGSSEHMCIVRELKLPAIAGVEHVKPFELDLTSDMIFDLIVK